MSQEKVDRYKKEKANRKKTNLKRKIRNRVAKVVAVVILVGLVGWCGYAGYNYYEDHKPVNKYYADLSAVTDKYANKGIAPGGTLTIPVTMKWKLRLWEIQITMEFMLKILML